MFQTSGAFQIPQLTNHHLPLVHLNVPIFTHLISSKGTEVFNVKLLYIKSLHIIEFVIDFIHN